jgi:hypothetical protein
MKTLGGWLPIKLSFNAFAEHLPRAAEQGFDAVGLHAESLGDCVAAKAIAVMQVDRLPAAAFQLPGALP